MSFIIIEGEEYILKIHEDNLLEFIIREGSVIDLRVFREVRSILSEYRPGVKYFIIAEGTGVFKVTMELRELCASKAFASCAGAIAFHSSNPSMILLGQLYNSINKPRVPTRVFYTRHSAWEWLQGKMTEETILVGRKTVR
jgi:hypothetical protein